MSSSFYLNGKSLAELSKDSLMALSLNNSAFLWGDSVFTSGRVVDGTLSLWKHHLKRLEVSLDWFFQTQVDLQSISNDIERLMSHHEGFDGRFRLAFFYVGDTDHMHWSFQLSDLNKRKHLMLKTERSPVEKYTNNSLVKIGSYADMYRAQRTNKSQLCFLTNDRHVLETSSGNLLFWHHGDDRWVTPNNELVLRGIGLEYGLDGLKIERKPVSLHDLKQFSAAYNVNAVYGPVPIEKIDDITFKSSHEKLMILNDVWRKSING